MKRIVLALSLFFSSFAVQAATLNITAQESRDVVEALLLAKVNPDQSKPVYAIKLSDFNCRTRYVSHAGSPDDIMWGMNEYECYNPAVEGAEAKQLYNTLDTLQTVYGDKIWITDCGMGKCVTSLKQIDCTIDSREEETSQRFACSLTDEQ